MACVDNELENFQGIHLVKYRLCEPDFPYPINWGSVEVNLDSSVGAFIRAECNDGVGQTQFKVQLEYYF